MSKQPDDNTIDRAASFRRSFQAMRTALRAISVNQDCLRLDESKDPDGLPCECPVCIAKAALEGEEEWRFDGYKPGRRQSSPREAALVAAWRHYFKHSAGSSNGTSAPMDAILSQILFGERDPNKITERDWYVATTIVQWLGTNVGQCVLFDAGYTTREPRQP